MCFPMEPMDADPEADQVSEASLVALLSPLFQARSYEAGTFLAVQGTAADTIFFIEAGECDICYDAKRPSDEDFDTEVSGRLGEGNWGEGGRRR